MLKKIVTSRTTVFIMLLLAARPATALQLTVDRDSALYALGETVVWKAALEGEERAEELAYRLKRHGLTVLREGVGPVVDGSALISVLADEPCTLRLETWIPGTDEKLAAVAGAAVAPERIQSVVTIPDDFDAFWAAGIAEMEAIPANPQLQWLPSGEDGVLYAKIEFDTIEGHKIRGQLARPAKGATFPAVFIPQWAGVYPLQRAWVIDRAREGWLALNIISHDLPIDEPEEYYAKQKAGPLNDYFGIGNDDRDRCYFRRMFLGCYRAVQYLTQREDWDNRTLVASGGSQGGWQALVAAGLHPAVTAVLANVPAGCETIGPLQGRAMSFPYWLKEREGRDPNALARTAPYFDAASFAPRIKVPVMVCIGLVDTSCPPSGIYATLNRSPAEKELNLMPLSGHQEVDGSQERWRRRSKAWLEALLSTGEQPVD